MEMSGVPGMPAMGSADTPMVTGSISGTSSTSRVDMSVLMGGLLPVDDDELTMEMINIGQDVYIRAPYFAALAEMAGGNSGPLGSLAELGEQWGYVDTATLAADAGDLGAVLGTGAGSPVDMLAALGTTSKTAPIGTETIHGVTSSGVRATVSLAAMMEAQSIDPSLVPTELSALGDLEIPVEVWLGDTGYITRMVFEMDIEAIAAAAGESGIPGDVDLDEMSGLVTTMTMESFDFGAADIVIAAPKEFIDVTAAFGDLLAEAQPAT